MLEASAVTVRYGGVAALQDLDFTVPARTVVGLVGPNGAGKTTLFGVLSGLVRPTSGHVLISGRDVTDCTPYRRAALGLSRTFQRVELFADLSVRQHVELAWRLSHGRLRPLRDLLGRDDEPDSRDRARLDELLDRLGLMDVANRAALSLPFGTARLVEVARALATDPLVVLLDEPASGLNAIERARLAAALVQACHERGVALVLVDHDLELVLGTCSVVNVLDFGRLLAVGPPDEIRQSQAVRTAYFGAEANQ